MLFSFVLRSLAILPASMVLDIVEGQRRGRRPKMVKIHYGVKTSRKPGGPKMAKIQYGVKLDIFKYALMPLSGFCIPSTYGLKAAERGKVQSLQAAR